MGYLWNAFAGTDRPHVDREHNEYGGRWRRKTRREAWSRDHLRFDPVHLNLGQRKEVEIAIADVAERFQ